MWRALTLCAGWVAPPAPPPPTHTHMLVKTIKNTHNNYDCPKITFVTGMWKILTTKEMRPIARKPMPTRYACPKNTGRGGGGRGRAVSGGAGERQVTCALLRERTVVRRAVAAVQERVAAVDELAQRLRYVLLN